MNILKNISSFNKKVENKEELNQGIFDQYGQIAKLVKETSISVSCS